jgi:hypothetical protein
MDCHVETYREFRGEGKSRALVIHTGSGRELYRTWPYASEHRARSRAWRWIHEEYLRRDGIGNLFVV